MEFSKWVNGWGLGVATPMLSEAQWAKDVTVRYVTYNTLDASAVRLYFTNRFNDEETELTHVTVAVSADGKGAVKPETITEVTFGGNKTGVMAPHGDIVSDDIPFEIKSGEKLTVSIYFAKFTHMMTGFTYENKFMIRKFQSGDATMDAELALRKASNSEAYNFLWSIDYYTYGDAYAVAAFGDSLTSQEWVDIKAQELIAKGINNRAIVRRAVSGSRIFGRYESVAYYSYGEAGMTRLEREVLHPGIEKVIIFHGINDLIHPDGKNPLRPMSNMPTVEKMAEGLTTYVDTAHGHGLKAYLATLLPIEGWRTYDIPRDDIRIATNEWIRNQKVSDGVIDFDKAVRDEEHPRRFANGCDRGDHLHASVEGYTRMSETLPPELFK